MVKNLKKKFYFDSIILGASNKEIPRQQIRLENDKDDGHVLKIKFNLKLRGES